MKYNIHNIWKGNAPPNTRQKVKGKRQKACSSETFYFELFTFSLIFKGRQLLNMRDGPRGRAPAMRFAMANELVTLNKSSVPLCGFSVDSVVKRKNHKERGEDTENTENYTLNPTKAFREYCTEDVRMQEERNMLEVENSKAGRNPDRSVGGLRINKGKS